MSKMRHIFCVFLLSVLFFCGVCFAEDAFTVNVVAYGTANSSTVAVDKNNSPVMVSAHIPGHEGLSIITQTPSGYEATDIPDTNYLTLPRLKITSNNELSLVYLKGISHGFEPPSFELWYGSKGSWFDWTPSKIEDSTSFLARPDMDLTSNDIPHIVYYGGDGSIFHAFFDVHSGQWIKEKLTGFGSGVEFSNLSIEIVPDGKIMISASADTHEVKVAVYSDGFWSYLPSLRGDPYIYIYIYIYIYGYLMMSSGSFTADSLPAVAFERSGQIIYAVYINDIIGWVETVVASVVPPSSSSHYSIALAHSSTNVPAIVYVDYRSLMYATNVAGGWTTTLIGEVGAVLGARPYLIFDRNDKPLMVYNGYDECADMPTLNIAGIGLEGFNIADLNNDKIVNFSDFAILAEHWMTTLPGPDKTVGDFDQNAKIDALDLRWLSCYWLNYAGH
jgi:hypothetical protein